MNPFVMGVNRLGRGFIPEAMKIFLDDYSRKFKTKTTGDSPS